MSIEESYLEVAFNIGCKLAKEAIWHDNKCNWLAQAPMDVYGSKRLGNKGIGLNYYSGSAGILEFFTLLSSKFQDAVFIETIEGIVENSFDNLDSLEFDMNFHFGKWGVLMSVLKASRQLSNTKWSKKAKSKADKILNEPLEKYKSEKLNGVSGLVPSLITMNHFFNEDIYIDKLQEIGNYILSSAEKDSDYWSWDSDLNNSALTGFGHGASGIAFALFQLSEVLQNDDYKEAALKALKFEDYHFHQREGNWKDLRHTNAPSMIAWCHGAAGIALSRLKAFCITNSPYHGEMTHTALETSMRYLNRSLDKDRRFLDYSLCHGIGGIADILLLAGRVLNEDMYIKTAIKAADFGYYHFTNKDLDWKGGLKNPANGRPLYHPSLILGSAGVGYFYLRMIDNQIPSVLT